MWPSKEKNTKRYYLPGIDARSSRNGILKYLENKNIIPTHLQLFNGKYNSWFISAKLNALANALLLSENFWPAGVRCREWLSNREWANKYETDYGHRDQNK